MGCDRRCKRFGLTRGFAASSIDVLDFRRIRTLLPLLGAQGGVSSLVASEVPLRDQKSVGTKLALSLVNEGMLLRVEGITPLTASLRQPDLTLREQRLIMADIVRQTLMYMPVDQRLDPGTIRIFGPGQDASLAEFEHVMIAQEARIDTALPVQKAKDDLIAIGKQDPVLRDLQSCAPGDFPVFWDFRDRLLPRDLEAPLRGAGLDYAAHLTMTRLTLVRAA